MRAEIIRTRFRRTQTTGEFIVYEGSQVIFEAKSLELDVDGNKEGESCIPDGEYNFSPLKYRPPSVTFSKEKQGYFPYLIHPVKNRSGILAHHGNFNSDILGCVILGSDLRDINNDGLKDVTNSRETLKKLNKVVKSPINLTVERFTMPQRGVDNVYLSD